MQKINFIILLLLGASFITLLNFSDSSSTLNHFEKVKVAGIILKWIPKEKEKNYKRAEILIREAAQEGAKIVCTSESFLDGYSIRDNNITLAEFRMLAEPIPNGKYITKLRKLAAELDIYLIAGLTELSVEKIYNSAVLIDPQGKIKGIYRKKFLWQDEKNKYSAGGDFPVFSTPFGKVGMMICYDRRHKEAMSELKKNGAEIVFCPAGGGYGTENDRVVSQRSREGKIPIVYVHPIEFLVTGPAGEILAQSLFGHTLDENKDESFGGTVRIFEIDFSRQ